MESTKSTYAISRCPRTQEPNPYLTTHSPDLRILFAEVFHCRGLEGDSVSHDIERKNIRTQQSLSKILVRESQEIANTNRVLCQYPGENLCSRFPIGGVGLGVFGNSNPIKFTLHPGKDSFFRPAGVVRNAILSRCRVGCLPSRGIPALTSVAALLRCIMRPPTMS